MENERGEVHIFSIYERETSFSTHRSSRCVLLYAVLITACPAQSDFSCTFLSAVRFMAFADRS